MIKNIVFDFGGVIANLNRERAVRTFEEMGIKEAADLLDPYHQKGVFLEVENGSCNAKQFCEKLSVISGREITHSDAKKGWLAFMEDVPRKRLKLIEELRKTYKIYVLSNINPFVMSWVHSNDFSGDGHSLDHYVDRIFTSYEIKIMKPDRGIFDFMIAQTELIPQESIFLDDGPRNVETAKILGFKTFQPVNGEDWTSDFTRMLSDIK